MVETMVTWGVEHVFGMVGHSNLGLADALRRQEEAGRLTYIGIRHEGAAAFAASAYGKLTGKPAACLTIAGPGATNLLTGLWDAKVDRAPVLALTGQVDSQVLGPGAFQEVDLAGAFGTVAAGARPCCRRSKPRRADEPGLQARARERDVSHLIFPDEVQTLPAAEGAEPGGPEGRVTSCEITPPPTRRSTKRGRTAGPDQAPADHRRPRRALQMEPIIELAERLGAPVITTFKAKGQIPDDHPLGGRRARAQRHPGRELVHERVRPAARVRRLVLEPHRHLRRSKPIIQVDFDPMQLGKFHPVEVPVWGEIGVVTRTCCSTRCPTTLDDRRPARRSSPSAGRSGAPRRRSREADDRGDGVSSASVFAAMNRHDPRGRGDRRRRRQPRLLVRPLLRVQAPTRC